MRAERQTAFQNILDCFTGVDGGIKFLRVKFALDDLDERAERGDEAAEELMQVLIRFGRLISAL